MTSKVPSSSQFRYWMLDSSWFREAVAAEAKALGIPDMSGGVKEHLAVMMHDYKFDSGLRTGGPTGVGSRYDVHRTLDEVTLEDILGQRLRYDEGQAPLVLAVLMTPNLLGPGRSSTRELIEFLATAAICRFLLQHGAQELKEHFEAWKLSKSLESDQ